MMRRNFARQRGAVTVIAAILFLAIVGIMSIVVNNISGTMLTDANTSDEGLQAEMIAESGLERAFYLLKKGGIACASIADPTSYTVAPGSTFVIESGVVQGSNCRVTVKAAVGSSVRRLTGVIPAYSFTEPFPNLAGWQAAVLSGSNTKGTNSYFSGDNCPVATCPGSTFASYRIQTNSGGTNNRYTGYRNRTIPPLATGATGKTINLSFALKRTVSGSGTSSTRKITISLVDSSAGVVTTLKVDDAAPNSNWVVVSSATTLPANRTYDFLRLSFDLRETNSNQIRVYVDEIKLY